MVCCAVTLVSWVVWRCVLGVSGREGLFRDFEHEGEPLLRVVVEGHSNAFGGGGHLPVCHLVWGFLCEGDQFGYFCDESFIESFCRQRLFCCTSLP